MMMKQEDYDPTVVDAFQKELIERSAGIRLKDARPEELHFIVSKSKESGNRLFKEKKYRGTWKMFRLVLVCLWGHALTICGGCADAIRMYSQGIAGDEQDHTLFGNRSAAYLALGLLDQALWDAQKSVTLKPDWAKGYYRLGCALENMNQWESALVAFSKGLEIQPDDAALASKVGHAQRRLEEDIYAKNAAAAVERHNLVLKLRNARHEDQKLAMLNQFKQSMTAPDWDLDDLEWRPTWLPSLRSLPVVAADWIRSEPKRAALLSYISALSDLSAPKKSIKILEDDNRLSWYLEAFSACFKSSKHALAISAGGGVLGLLAAQAGATTVTQVERCRMLYRMAKQIKESNKDLEYAARVELVSGVLESVKVKDSNPEFQSESQGAIQTNLLPLNNEITSFHYMNQQAEVLIVDLMDHTVLGMGLLSAIDHAAEHLLAQGAQVIPGSIRVLGQLVELKLDQISGFDLSAMDCYRWYPGDERFDQGKMPLRTLSQPFIAGDIDLSDRVKRVHSGTLEEENECIWEMDKSLKVKVSKSGQWNGVVFWFELSSEFNNHILSSSPVINDNGTAKKTYAHSFGQGIQYLDSHKVTENEEIVLQIRQDQSQIIFSSHPPQHRMHHAIVPRWHYDMLLDAERNNAYDAAIKKAVNAKKQARSDKNVHCIDMGAGSGLLSMMAARAGADYVYAAEMNSHMCDVAEECTIMNGFLDKILVLDRDVRRMDVLRKPDGTAPELQRPVDLAVFEVFDSGLIGEGILHILAAAKAKLLMPDAYLVPCSADVYAQPIQLRVNSVKGLDVQQANRWRWRSDYEGVELGKDKSWVPLADPIKVFSFDFYDIEKCVMENENTLNFSVDKQGKCNAVAMWFKLHLDDEIMLNTSPYEEKGPTWQQAVQFIKEVNVNEGDDLQIQARHDTYSISYNLIENGIEDKFTDVPLYDEVWKAACDRLESFNSEIVKSCVQNPLEYRFVSQSSVQLAARPHDFNLEASQASEFCSRIMG